LPAGPPEHPFVGSGPYRQPCPAAPPRACNGGMQTERGLLAATPEPGRYDIDVSSSTVTFRTRHLFGLAPVRGAFALQSGAVDVAEPPAGSGIQAGIQAGIEAGIQAGIEAGIQAGIESASFRTGNPERDRSVRSARLLNSAEFPAITFGNGHVGPDGRTVSGELTVRDVTRPVTFPVRVVAVSRESFTASAAIRIDRTEFGVTALRGLAGWYLDVVVEVRCVRK